MTDVFDNSRVQTITRMQQDLVRKQYHRDNPVVHVCEAMRDYITEFEASLEPDQEVGVRLVTFGNAVTFHAEEIGFCKPHIISFKGITPDGERVRLIQHVSQLSFLLKAVKKLADKPRRIGFVWSD